MAFRVSPFGRVADGLWRGSSSLTYSNAAASLIGAIILVYLGDPLRARRSDRRAGDAADEHDGRIWRQALLSDLVLFVLMAGLLVTQSRGGLAASLVGGLILLVRLGPLRLLRPVLVPGIGAIVAALPVLAASSTSVSARPAQALAGLFLGATIVVAAPFVSGRLAASLATGPRRVVLVPVLCLGLAAAIFGLSRSDSFADIAERRLTLSSDTASGEVVFFGDRSHEWRAAADQFQSRPLLGVGAGELQLRWTEEDGGNFYAMFVHNEYLELAATHGILGLFALALGAVLVIDDMRRRRHAVPYSCRWGCYAALITLLLHSALDYLWHIPLVPIVMAAIVGLLLRRPHLSDSGGFDPEPVGRIS